MRSVVYNPHSISQRECHPSRTAPDTVVQGNGHPPVTWDDSSWPHLCNLAACHSRNMSASILHIPSSHSGTPRVSKFPLQSLPAHTMEAPIVPRREWRHLPHISIHQSTFLQSHLPGSPADVHHDHQVRCPWQGTSSTQSPEADP